MRKLLSIIFATVMAFALCVSAFAANETDGTTTLTATISSNYNITIPADASILFEAVSTPIGNVGISEARLEPNKKVTISASTDGELVNTADTDKVIAYALKSGGQAFTSASFMANGTVALTIDIEATAWNSAVAGTYKDAITFTAVYESIA